MRRKLFFITILTIIIICCFDGANLLISRDAPYYETEKSITFEGKISSIIFKGDDYYQMEVLLSTGEKFLLNYYSHIENYDQLYLTTNVFRASLSSPQCQRNPGCFDYERHLQSLGISFVGTVHSFETQESDFSYTERIRKTIFQGKKSFLEKIEDDRARGMISGILFGEKELLDEDVYEQFKANGTAHILAVSGLHIGIVYTCLEKILGKRQSPFKILAIIASLLLMGEMANWSVSVTRSIGMILMKMSATMLDRRYDQLTAASGMAMLLIIDNYNVVFNTGFQMSFLAVASISFILPHISKKVPDYLATVIAVNLGLIPYQIYQFNSFSIISFIVNVPVVYIAGILMPLAGMVFVLFLMGFNWVITDYILESIAVFTIKINQWFSFGMENMDVVSPPLWCIFIVYGIVFFLLSETFYILISRKEYKKVTIFLGLIAILCVTMVRAYPDTSWDCQLTFVDVGQGAAVHIREENIDILIDGGGNVNYNVGKKTLKPYLLKNGCKKVDLALATHMHTDHYLGLEELADENMIDTLRTGLVAGDTYRVAENLTIKTLWPLEKNIGQNGEDPSQDENRNCSVFMIYYDDIKILITGDLDSEGEKAMMSYYDGKDVLKADIMQIGHHGSKYSTSDEFLDLVDPTYCVIQVGKNNYGHPHAKIIEKCAENGIMLFRNDWDGAVGFTIHDKNVEIQKMIKDR